MKKTYDAPVYNAVEVNFADVITASLNLLGGADPYMSDLDSWTKQQG